MVAQWAAQRVREAQAERARQWLPAVLYAVDEPTNPQFHLDVVRKTVEQAFGITEPDDIREYRTRSKESEARLRRLRQSLQRKAMHPEVRSRIEHEEQRIASKPRHDDYAKTEASPDYKQAAKIANDDDGLGPMFTDPEHGYWEAAALAARREARAAEKAKSARLGGEEEREQLEASAVDPWSFVTLSGAKMLAQEHGVSYAPRRVKRDALVEQLKRAGVKPPAPPSRPATEDDFTDPDLR
jgi:hypothetical protein